MKTKIIALTISVLFMILAIFVSNLLIESSIVYKKEKQHLAESLSYKKRFFDQGEWHSITEKNEGNIDYLKQKVSIVLAYGSSQEHKKIYKEQLKKIKHADALVRLNVFIVLICILIYLFVMMGFYYTVKNKIVLLITILSISIVCLYTGLYTPMLEIGAIERNLNLGEISIQKEIFGVSLNITVQKQFEGDTYFYYQSKSIIELIWLLFKQHNYMVALSILIFSVIFPLIKTCLMGYFIIKPDIAQKKWFNGFVLNLSKWSMADVFVVAIFLGFLAFGNLQAGVGTYSHVSTGLYFFFVYCILSIVSSSMAKQVTTDKN